MDRKKSHRGRFVSAVLGAALAVVAAVPAFAQVDADEVPTTVKSEQLLQMSLEDLMNVQITSVAKQKQKVSQAPAAVSVISQDDIRRSGMSSIPELLRLSPGLDVAQISASSWAVSSRGFNDIYANKLLVLMDGRTVYTPAFSGVYWDSVDYILPDLERIEVVRGPGATLWGANAVNGVINIMTKSADETQGWLVDTRAGNLEQIGGIRYGGKIDDRTYYRVYGKYRNETNFSLADGDDAHDGWEALRGGFRIDRFATDQDILTLQGDVATERAGYTNVQPVFTPPTFSRSVDESDNHGAGNVLARWTHVISPTSDFSLQLYYDNVRREDFYGNYTLNTFDVDFQHRFELTRGQQLIWGTGFRFQADRFPTKNGLVVVPDSRDAYLASAFVQDDITLVQDRLHLILGSKFEQNSYTGFEWQPSGRLLWTPNEHNSVWASISRAVRTPSRTNEDARIPLFRTTDPNSGLPVEVDITGNNQLYSDQLVAYEVGYRTQITRAVSIDVSAFLNHYDNLDSLTLGQPALVMTGGTPIVRTDATWNNKRHADAYGVELAANWNVTDNWRLVASYTWLNVHVHSTSSDTSPIPESSTEDNVPHNQIQLRSYLDITKNLELNAAAYYVENLSGPGVPSYVRVDMGLTWRPKKDVELSVGVQNLFDDRHPEFGGQFGVQSSEVPRAVYGQLAIKF